MREIQYEGGASINEKILYQKLVSIIDVSIIETSEIWTKGIFLAERGLESKIYIKKGLPSPEKLQVLLHEYTHYLHITKFYENENRAESEIIAESLAFFVLREFGIASSDKPVLAEFTQDLARINHLSAKIQPDML